MAAGENMAKEWAKPFYNSKAWKQARDLYIQMRIETDGGLCETCGEVPGYIVHHKIPLTPDNINDYDVSLKLDNFEYDCKSCHDQKEEHEGWNKKIKLLVEFDADGQPIPKKQHSPLSTLVNTECGRPMA